jgi:hypothetical protein
MQGSLGEQIQLAAEKSAKAGARSGLAALFIPDGRLIKLHMKNEAEIAILVSDQCQKQGLGIESLRRIVQIAH